MERKEGEGGYENLIGMGGLMGVGVFNREMGENGEKGNERCGYTRGRGRGVDPSEVGREHVF